MNDLFGGHPVSAEPIGVDTHHNRPLAATEWRRCGNSGQSGEQGPHAVQRKILNFSDASSGARKYQVAHGYTSRVKTQDKWGDRSRRHESPGTVDVPDGLSRGLTHVRAGMENQFHQPHVLNGLRFDGFNSGDVEKMIFVVVDEIALHLRRGHAAVRLCHIDDGQIQIRKDIDGHAQERENRAKCHTNDGYEDTDRMPERGAQQPHGYGPPCGF